MRLGLLLICIFAVFSKGVSSDMVDLKPVDFSHGRLVISDNKRYLVHEDGTPFFYFADTAWQLFHRLTREEINHYFQNRVKKGLR